MTGRCSGGFARVGRRNGSQAKQGVSKALTNPGRTAFPIRHGTLRTFSMTSNTFNVWLPTPHRLTGGPERARDHPAGRPGVHAETIIGAAAALAGEFALRAAEPKLPENGWVISQGAHRIIFGDGGADPVGLWHLICEGAVQAGATPSALPQTEAVAARTAQAVGGSPYPPLSVPDKHYPHEWSPNACPRLRQAIEKTAAQHGIDHGDTARALALAIVLLIAQTKAVLPPATSATLALEIMAGVARMAPLAAPIQ